VKRVAVVTVGRSDYGILRPVLAAIEADPALELFLVVAAAHLRASYGLTVSEIEADGFAIGARIDMLTDDDSPTAVAASFGRGVPMFADAYEASGADLLLLLGDRYETLAAAVAAVPLRLPIAHIHGGETTEGALDDALRHAITMLSHLHFAATEEYAARIVAMGEEAWRVTVSGAPALDNLALLPEIGPAPDEPESFLLATWHPVTLEPERGEEQLEAVLGALADVGLPVVFTHPNADPGRAYILRAVERFAAERDDVQVISSLGTEKYFRLMARDSAMVGNSSSGIIEAASFELPVVNVGSRQRGRSHGVNVLDVPPERQAVAAAIRRAVTPEFRAGLRGLPNPYGDGRASERIAEVLRTASPADELLVKRLPRAG